MPAPRRTLVPPPRPARASGVVAGLSGLAVAAVLGSLVGCSPDRTSPAEASVRAMNLVVTPHPDDELEAWSLIGAAPAETFTVFLTLTNGEATVNCEPARVVATTQQQWGERVPEPWPLGAGTQSCKDARIGSWNAFLDAAATTPDADPALPVLADMTAGDTTLGGRPARTWIAPTGARIAVDAGDGALTEALVGDIVREVLDLRGQSLPGVPLRQVIGAAYLNDPPERGDEHYAPYRHPDHRAVREALLAGTFDAAGGTCVATWPSDPARTRQADIPASTYDAFLGLGEPVDVEDPLSLQRVGSFQEIYGWLAFGQSYWPQGQDPVADVDGHEVLMSSRQTFICSQ